MNMNVEESVVHNLLHGCRDKRIEAARRLCRLGKIKRKKLAEKGIIPVLFSMIQSGDYEGVESALFGLLSLAFGSERNKIRIVDCGAIPVLLKLLDQQNISANEIAVATLLTLSSCRANKPVIASSGAIGVILGILREFEDDYQIQAKSDAISTLHNLVTCHQSFKELMSSGIVSTLIHVIQSGEKGGVLVEKAMALLEGVLILSDAAIKQAVDGVGTIRALVEAVEEGTSQCKEKAANILLIMCQRNRKNHTELLLNEGVVPGLLQLTVDGTWEAKGIAQELLFLLRDCSRNCSQQLLLNDSRC